MSPIWIERAEGAIFFVFAMWAYIASGASWWMFALLILAPDTGILGYLIDAKWGARTYNILHTYVTPLLAGVLGFLLNNPVLLYGSIVWIAHIGADRALGYGLKLPTGFRDTHLGRVGKVQN